MFLKFLRRIVKEKSIAKIQLHDDTTLVGFITEANRETFVIHCRDPIFNQNVTEVEDGVMCESFEDFQGIDCKFSENVYPTEAIFAIEMDVTHKFSLEQLTYQRYIRETLFPATKEKPTKTKPAKPSSKPTPGKKGGKTGKPLIAPSK